MTVKNNDTTVCVMRGFYNEEGEFVEQYLDDVALCELPETAKNRINVDYDITILYSRNDVLLIAKNSQDIDEYKKLEGNPRFLHSLLHMAEYRHHHYDGYMCMLIKLKALKKTQMKIRICNPDLLY